MIDLYAINQITILFIFIASIIVCGLWLNMEVDNMFQRIVDDIHDRKRR